MDDEKEVSKEIQTSEAGSNDGLARPGAADDYLNILKPKKGPGRLEYDLDLPETLTPRGYVKLKSTINASEEQPISLICTAERDCPLWEDPDFPASDASIGISEFVGKIEWKRPKEINSDAELFVDGVSRFDIGQGDVGNCWFLAAVSSIARYPALFDHVVPKNQSIQGPNYTGSFHARFWRFGRWVDVVVDDRLPVHKDLNKLIFAQAPGTLEYWPALLEKAYAKIHNSYIHLESGTLGEAMEDLTGGVTEDIWFDDLPDDLLQQMIIYSNRCCLMGCVHASKSESKYGLIRQHAYSVTGIQPVDVDGRTQYLVRCRNPWGNEYEWTGPWSDKSSEWDKVSQKQKEALDLKFHADGEFWISFEDFVSCFSLLEVCHLGLESLEYNQDLHGRYRLQESIFTGSWERGVSAGGMNRDKRAYWTNPQFSFTISDPDPDDDENKCFVVIALVQRGVRAKKGDRYIKVGFALYQVENNHTGRLTLEQSYNAQLIAKPVHKCRRGVTNHYRLSPGTYVVIPSTTDQWYEGQFIVRILTQVPINDRELSGENTFRGPEIPIQLKSQPHSENEDLELEKRFNQLADPEKGTIEAKTLAKLINESSIKDARGFTGFGKEFCRSLLASMDLNITGQMTYSEFTDLWSQLKSLRAMFEERDTQKTGSISVEEFREALSDAGFTVSNKVFSALMRGYADLDKNSLDFDDFLLCAVRLRSVLETADAQAKHPDGSIIFTLEDYLRFSAYI
ncbi:unnamed protein product [Calicophoron daubneyi]|uniref:Uncharacterized protein n=1 Tax=Calicophoron daubneyi TaxID=300641 RepID=A0AAV2TVU6_CALDB